MKINWAFVAVVVVIVVYIGCCFASFVLPAVGR